MIDFDRFADDVLSTEAFGQEATFIPSGGQGKAIKVVFDNAFSAMQGLGEAGVSSSSPQAECKSTDVDGAARGDTLRVGDTTYYVTEAQPDGFGMTLLILSKDQ